MEASSTTPVVKVGLPPGSSLSPSSGVSERRTCTGSLSVPQGPGTEAIQITKRRKKNKGPKKETCEGDPNAVDVNSDDRGYSRALADPNILEVVLEDVSGNDYVPHFVDSWASRGALV